MEAILKKIRNAYTQYAIMEGQSFLLRNKLLRRVKVHICNPQPIIAEGMSSLKLWKGRCGKITMES